MTRRQSERDLQAQVVAVLKLTVPPQWWFCPNTEVRGGKDAARAGAIASSRGANKGWADVLIVNPRTMAITGIELKSKRGVLSEAQKLQMLAWRDRYFICRTLEDARFAIKQAGWDTTRSLRMQSSELTVMDAGW